LTGLRDAQIADKTLFLSMFINVLPEEISVWISKEDLPSSMCGHQTICGGPRKNKEVEGA
jgi:hypothetical protein